MCKEDEQRLQALVQLQWFSAGMFWRERGQRMSATFTTNTTVTIATTLQRGFRKLGQRALSEHTLGLFMLRHPCRHVACGNDVIIYDVGNLVLILVYIIGTPEVVCCVEVSTELSHHCRHVVWA